ncbi:MAG: hypothetical protein EP332_11650 [Bacteroidetes bacterium]|nr:MAG: hypothetical protein EP332_11650 [Bacteroidota bacterium]
MSLTVLILLLLAGIILIAMDILFIPGGIVAFFGLGLMIFADYGAYESLGSTGGHLFTLASVVAFAVILVQIFRPSFWKRVSEPAEVLGKVNTEDLQHCKVGDEGTSLTRLRPSGNARFGNHVVEVFTRHEFIEANQAVKVTSIDENRIYVQTLKTE